MHLIFHTNGVILFEELEEMNLLDIFDVMVYHSQCFFCTSHLCACTKSPKIFFAQKNFFVPSKNMFFGM